MLLHGLPRDVVALVLRHVLLHKDTVLASRTTCRTLRLGISDAVAVEKTGEPTLAQVCGVPGAWVPELPRWRRLLPRRPQTPKRAKLLSRPPPMLGQPPCESVRPSKHRRRC